MLLEKEAHIARLLDISENTVAGITIYAAGGGSQSTYLSYRDFHALVRRKADQLRLQDGIAPGKIVLIYFPSHLEALTWFWASVLVGCIPAIFTPLEHKEAQNLPFKRLNFQLGGTIVITTRDLASSYFSQSNILEVIAVEDIESLKPAESSLQTTIDDFSDTIRLKPGTSANSRFDGATRFANSINKVAVIILTSERNGFSKVVCLTHSQIFSSLKGMMASMPLPFKSSLLNWTALDQFSSIVEIHLYAMFAELDQVHVPTQEVFDDPLLLLRLLSQHKVSRTFAPRSFLYKLQLSLDRASTEETQQMNLGGLLYIGSSGEANLEDCARINDIFARLRGEDREALLCSEIGKIG
ncbi:hypothetical protein HYFRA_00000162 [Hymenoscyphus fraxineus]|uniref:AMP-dependent synthetase/ligase domain-containing protein n=1 Tax=Hymenoscyphus fraxineus TaxID=746836 RepID=A0A9N9L6D2_9HELO|nr:hypothetical protein HYFRA_00000162 [Hymenoscyphus fraxineus]